MELPVHIGTRVSALRKQYHTRNVDKDQHIWDVHRLVRLAKELPAIAVSLSEIAEADELWWYQDAKDIPTPRSIANHMALVAQTDLKYPIILCEDGRLMDGMHRVVKALLEKKKTILAVRFSPTPTPDFINVDPSQLRYPDEEL